MAIRMSDEFSSALGSIVFGLEELGLGEISNIQLPGCDGDCQITLKDGTIFGAAWTQPSSEGKGYDKAISIKRYLPYGVVAEYWRATQPDQGFSDIAVDQEAFIPYSNIAHIHGNKSSPAPGDAEGST